MITEKIFTRGNGEKVRYSQIGSIVADYIAKAPNASYEITVGTDSQNHKCTRMVEVIAVHRIGDGGIFFYRKQDIPKIRVLKTKIQEETSRSIENATGFVDALAYALIDYDLDLDEDETDDEEEANDSEDDDEDEDDDDDEEEEEEVDDDDEEEEEDED